MLQDYLDKLSQSRQSHPISQGDLEAFRENPVFKRLLNDMEESLLYMLDYIGNGKTIEDINNLSVRFGEMKNSIDFIKHWVPEELINEESE